jgi:lipid-binding SYLF domain-containing protein
MLSRVRWVTPAGAASHTVVASTNRRFAVSAFARRAASTQTKSATSVSPPAPQGDGNDDDKPSISKVQALTNRAIEVAPGVLAAGVVMQGGFALAGQLGSGLLAMQGIEGVHASPVSGISIAILLGLGIGNSVPGCSNQA